MKEADEKIKEHKKLQDLIAEKDQEIEHLKRSLSEVNQENEKLKEQITIGVSKEKIGALNKGLKKAMV